MSVDYVGKMRDDDKSFDFSEGWAVVVRPRRRPSQGLAEELFEKAQSAIGGHSLHLILCAEHEFVEQWENETKDLQYKPIILTLNPNNITAKSEYEAPSYAVYRYIKGSFYKNILFMDDIYLSFYLYQGKNCLRSLQNIRIMVSPSDLVAARPIHSFRASHDVMAVRERMEKECLMRSDLVILTSEFEINWIELYLQKNINAILVAPNKLHRNALLAPPSSTERKFIIEVSHEPSVSIVTAVSSCLTPADTIIIIHDEFEGYRKTVMKLAAMWGSKCTVRTMRGSDFRFGGFSHREIYLFVDKRLSLTPFFFTVFNLKLNYLTVVGSPYAEIVHERRRVFQTSVGGLAKSIAELSDIGQPTQIADTIYSNISTWTGESSVKAYKNILQRECAEVDVTVCICHYDRPRYLLAVLDAISAQTIEALEILIVDDGSNLEESRNVIDQLSEKKYIGNTPLRIIRTPDIGLGAARNAAAAQAAGQYILFIDDDNIPLPHMLEVLRDAAALSRADVITCLAYQYEGFDWALHENSEVAFLPLGGVEGLGYIFNCFGDANCLIRLQSLRHIGGFASTRIPSEDWELFARMTLRGMRVQLVPEVLLAYRSNDAQSLTVRTSDDEQKFTQITSLYQSKYNDIAPFFFNLSRSIRFDHGGAITRHVDKASSMSLKNKDARSLEFRGVWTDLSLCLEEFEMSPSSAIAATILNHAEEAIELRFALICDSLDKDLRGEFCTWFRFEPGLTFVYLPIIEMRVERGLPNIRSPRVIYLGGAPKCGMINATIDIC